MKYATTLVTLGFTLGVISGPIATRSLEDAVALIESLRPPADALESAAKDYSSDDDDSVVLGPCSDLVASLDSVAGSLNGMDAIDEADQGGLPRYVSWLGRSVYRDSMAAFIEGKAGFVDGGVASGVKACINQILASTDQLIEGMVHVAPTRESTIRIVAPQQIYNKHIQPAIDEYADVEDPGQPTETTTDSPGPTDTATPGPTDTDGPTGTETDGPTVSETDGPTGTETDGPTGTETDGPTGTETDGPTGTETDGPTVSETDGPTGTETDGPTGTGTDGPTGTETDCPPGTETDGSTGTGTDCPPGTETDGPTGTETADPTKTGETCDPEGTATITVTATVTECGPGTTPPPGDGDDGGDDDGDDGGDDGGDDITPPDYDGAGSVNKVGTAGVMVAIAAILIL